MIVTVSLIRIEAHFLNEFETIVSMWKSSFHFFFFYPECSLAEREEVERADAKTQGQSAKPG